MRVLAQFLLCTVILLVFFFCFPQGTFASFSSCSTGASPDSIIRNSSGDITIVVNNSDTVPISWVKIVRPNSNWIINGADGQGFDAGINENDVTFTSGSINPSDSHWFTISMQSADVTDSGSWSVLASDGGDPVSCGNPPASIINPSLGDLTISDVVISDVTADSVKISWTTDRDANSFIDYGLDSNYGSEQSDPGFTSSHSIILTGLTPNTGYHYMLKSQDNYGNTIQTNDNSFVSAVESSAPTTTTQTVTVTTTTTKTVTVTPTPVPTPVPDTTPPSISITTDFSKPFTVSPKITGSANDNKAVAKIDYSLDGGQNWSPVDNMSAPNAKSTNFDFTPQALDDGNYDLKIRATDSSGNKGFTKTYILVIDRLPPQVSGVLFSLGSQVINPRQDGSILTIGGQPLKITLSEVGGSTKVDIIVFNLKTHVLDTYPLTKNSDNGLWSGTLPLGQKGEYQLKFSAIDGANNKTETNLNKIVVVGKGFAVGQSGHIANSKITVFYQEPTSKTWQIWDGGAYFQTNPQNTDKNGNYSLFLPAGKYYIQTDADGYQTLETEFFSIDNAEPINANFSLKESKLLISLGTINIYYPDFSAIITPFINNIPEISANTNSLVGKQAPFFNLVLPNQGQFDLNSLKGKPTVISFLNTWSPSSSEQVSILDKLSKNNNYNSVTIVEGDKNSKVYVFEKRGGYGLNMIADSDATLIIPYGLSTLPTHYFLDRKGIIRDVVSGVLNQDELESKLLNISD
jgi:peroxiredoxin